MTRFLSTVFLAFLTSFVYSQEFTGLWEVTEVIVGEETMTPVGRWSHIHSDGTFETGNGWLQNCAGTWKYDTTANGLSFNDTNGFEDPYPNFEVSVSDDKMTWHREEDGNDVHVTLRRIEQLPKAPANEIVGVWKLTDAYRSDASIMDEKDPEGVYTLFFRWDGRYIEWKSDGQRVMGYWQMNAHRPTLTMIQFEAEPNQLRWTVEVNDDLLQMNTETTDGEPLKLVYERRRTFP